MMQKGVIKNHTFWKFFNLKMAEATIKGYKMGEDNITDFLAINIASTDYVGHAFGPKFYRNRRYLFKIRQRFRSVFSAVR